MKKRLVFITVITLLIIVAAIYFISHNVLQKTGDPYKAVPGDAAMIFEFHDLDKQVQSIKSDSLWQVLREYGVPARMDRQVTLLDSLFDQGNFPGEAFRKGPLLAALLKVKATDYELLFVLPVGPKGKIDPSWLEDFTGRPPVERTFKGVKILEMKMPGYGKTLAMAYQNGLAIASFDPFLLESAISQMGRSGHFSNQASFTQVREWAGKSNRSKILVNFDALDELFSVYLNNGYTRLSKQLGDVAEWGAINFSIVENVILLNGYTSFSNEKKELLSLLTPTDQISNIASILPYNTALFYSFNTSSIDPLVNRHLEGETLNTVYRDYFMNWMGHETGFAIVEPFSGDFSDEVFVAVQTPDTSLARSQLTSLIRGQTREVEISPALYKGFDLYHLDQFDHLEIMAGLSSRQLKNPYFTFVNDYVVFSNSIANLKVLIERYLEQQTLSKDIDYIRFKQQMTDDATVNLYLNTGRMLQLLKTISNDQFGGYLDRHFSAFKQLAPIGIQFSPYKKGYFLFNGLVQSSEGFQQQTNLLWKAELDTIATSAPFLTENHYTGEKEILIQDAWNNIYLISNSGEVLWKKNLESPIVGPVHLVDFYNNQKIQYFFATRDKIHLLDRNGQNVESFPLRLPSPVTSGLAVFDYTGSNNLRLFVGCENGNFYGFRKSGRPLPGWNPKRDVGIISSPLQHKLHDAKDYLVANNDQGTLFLWNRKGELRVPEIKLQTQFHQPFFFDTIDKKLVFVNAGDDGKIFTVGTGGNFTTDSLRDFQGEVQFLYHDLDDDGHKDYFLKDTVNFYGFDPELSMLFESVLPENIAPEMLLINVPVEGEEAIGFYGKEKGQIYLYDRYGNLYEDFPLPGFTPFQIAELLQDETNIIITGTSDNSVTTYRLK